MQKIIASIGPASAKAEVLSSFQKQGVSLLRLNFSHFTPEKAKPVVQLINQIDPSKSFFKLIMDLEGPGMRTGVLLQPRAYKKGEQFKLYIDTPQEENALTCDYPGIINDVEVGNIVRIESGLFDTIVCAKGENYLLLEAMNDFVMTSKRHINLPGAHVNQATITETDWQNIEFAIQNDFSYIAISFCRTAEDVRMVREFLIQHQASHIQIIAKIENQEGLDNLDEIVEASDMIMVARGDLGTEIPLEKVPEEQMKIVKTCQLKNTPVIIATQMMSSMVDHPTPTRAEVSDVFLAVREGVDYVMLSEETTVGNYPIETIEMMQKIITEAQD